MIRNTYIKAIKASDVLDELRVDRDEVIQPSAVVVCVLPQFALIGIHLSLSVVCPRVNIYWI